MLHFPLICRISGNYHNCIYTLVNIYFHSQQQWPMDTPKLCLLRKGEQYSLGAIQHCTSISHDSFLLAGTRIYNASNNHIELHALMKADGLSLQKLC